MAQHHHHHHTSVDARHIEFNASPDHDALDAHGNPLLDRYQLEIFVKDQYAPIETANLGKPEPNDEGEIRMDFVSRLRTPLTPGVTYEAAVAAVGPYGTSKSERSNPFSFRPPPCDPWISPTSMEVDNGGGSVNVTVNAAERCTWTAVSNAPWLTIVRGASDAGRGIVTVRVAPNTAKPDRRGTVTIAGSTFKVIQDGNDDQKNKDRDRDRDR